MPIYGNTTGFGTVPSPTDVSAVPSSRIPPSPGLFPSSSVPTNPGLVSGSTVTISPSMMSSKMPGFSVTSSAAPGM